MKKLLITALIGVCSAATVVIADNAVAADTPATTAKKPQPKHRLIKHKPSKKATPAKPDTIAAGSAKWSCEDGLAFYLSGDMKRDGIVTVNWSGKNYQLPRENTTTGADRFHDAASGLDLVVIPTKAMLFSDKDSARLADECKTPAMVAGSPAPTQANALGK
jgi:hypothetical protein